MQCKHKMPRYLLIFHLALSMVAKLPLLNNHRDGQPGNDVTATWHHYIY